jgi:hypothetical protein
MARMPPGSSPRSGEAMSSTASLVAVSGESAAAPTSQLWSTSCAS